jgi:hypothetical protein
MKDLEAMRAYLADTIDRFGPPLPADELAELERILDLPRSYVDCLAKVGLDGVTLPGYCELSPSRGCRGTFRERLLQVNNDAVWWRDVAIEQGLVEVAAWNEFPIFIVRGSHRNAGTVFHYNIDLMRFQRIASSFEIFLLRVGRIARLLDEHGDAEAAITSFLGEIEPTVTTDEEREIWRNGVSVALS